MSTLLLSLVLVILITNNRLFGLFLFLSIGMLLSHAFQQLFLIYSQMSEKANKDQRTSLFSHSYFEDKLEEHMKLYRDDHKTFSLALLDLDDFKRYNDSFGHLQGDRLLSFFGNLVREECELKGFTAARYGGEEFSIIMPGLTEAEGREFINVLRRKTNDSTFTGVEVFPHGCISFSAGIAEMKQDLYDKSQLIDHADQAQYISKSKGKNTVWMHSERADTNALPEGHAKDLEEIEQQVRIFMSKDIYTYKHSKRVYSYALDIAEFLQLNEEDRRLLVLGAFIHDIGKIEIPRDILNKKSRLTEGEWEMVKKHVTWGKEILLASGRYRELVPLVELHHERYDGKGYPHGLKGEEIPRLARLLCIIDSFDAMTTERPYQRTKTYEEALEELQVCSGSHFDPELAAQFMTYVKNTILSRKQASAAAEQV
ncbi:HD domain-containing phosphohydrolase [Paenibacillus sp. GCM10023252]|uniref:bifunctional diguanylate cyclase/phosphohydrolase n=1 Tax=Paenibacillus sp. GCM10023252 TaxID=3252649 RepID=UPI0036107366